MSQWKITPAERRAIRAFAARSEKLKPRQIKLSVGERYNIDDAKKHLDETRRSTNIYLVTDHPDWDDTDLYETWDFFAKIGSIPLTREGRALVDFYVYKNDRDEELLTNVQAYVETVDGKPKLVKLSGTGVRSIGRSDIEALMA